MEITSLKLDADTRTRCERYFCNCIQDGVMGSGIRDQLLVEWDDQLHGRYIPAARQRWQNSCEMNDSITMEVFITLLAMLMQVVRRDPKFLLDARDPTRDHDARTAEDWLNNTCQAIRMSDALYEVAYNVLRDPAAVLFTDWHERTRPQQFTGYRHKDADADSLPIEAHEKQEGEEYDEVPMERDVVEAEGCKLRAVDLANFYLYPANAGNVGFNDENGAIGCGERIWFTAGQLLDGIEDFAFDEESVENLIRGGATHSQSASDWRGRQDAYMGVDEATQHNQDGYFECFIWYQRLPRWIGTDQMDIPKEYHRRDCVIVGCPERNIVLKMTLAADPDRPYTAYGILPKPHMFLGTGWCQMAEQIQEEMTTALRNCFDNDDLKISPPLICSIDDEQELKKKGRGFPGQVWGETQPNTIRWLVNGNNPLADLERIDWLRGRAQSLASAQGYGEMQSKQRKAAEVEAVTSAADSKFDLLVSNFQVGMTMTASRILALHAAHPDSLQTPFRNSRGAISSITAEMIEGQFNITAAASSTNVNPDARFKIAQAKAGVFAQYVTALQTLQPQWWPFAWHASRTLLLDLGERQPEQWIGPEPVPPAQGAPNIPAMIAALQQQGVDPHVIQAALQVAQQQGQSGLNMASAANGVLSPGAAPVGVA